MSVVAFTHLLATNFKKKNTHTRAEYYWCILCNKLKREIIFSLCLPQTLFQVFEEKKNIQQNLLTYGTGSAKMITRFPAALYITSPL